MNDFENLVGILIPSTFVVALVIERLLRAKELPKVRFWLLKGLVFFALTGGVNAVVPLIVAHIVGDRAPLHLARVGLVPGALIAFLVTDVVAYFVHRTMHRVRRSGAGATRCTTAPSGWTWPACRTTTRST